MRIVFDSAATCNGGGFNDYANRGPKLQNELFEILIEFQRFPIALVCGFSEKYLQVGTGDFDKKLIGFCDGITNAVGLRMSTNVNELCLG